MAIAAPPITSEYVEYSGAQRWIILCAIMLGTLLQVVDSSIVNVAIPSMMGNLGATLSQISWVSTGYIIANVIMLPLTGWFSTRFGRRRYLAVSMMVFTAASLFCGTAHSLHELILYRVIQGIGGAALLSTAQATMMEVFPPHQLGMVQAIYGIGIMVGPTIGPTLGGWITDNYTWPWIFFINLPIGIVATILTLLFVHDSKYKHKKGVGVDVIGIGLLAVGLGCLQMFLEEGNKEGWFQSTFICWLAALALLGIVSFILWELYTPNPAVNLRVLKNRTFAAGTLYGAAVGVGLYGGIFILPVFLQQLRQYSAQQSGFMMLPGAIATTLMMPIIGRLVGKVIPRTLVMIGTVVFVISCLMLTTITMQTGPENIFWPLVIRGAAMGFLFVPLSLATLTVLKGKEMADGAGLFNLSRQLGGSAGIALLSTFIDHRTMFHRAMLVEHINAYNPLALQRLAGLQQMFMGKGSSAVIAKMQALGVIDLSIKGQSALMAFSDAFILIALIFLASIPLLLFFKAAKMPSGPRTQVTTE